MVQEQRQKATTQAQTKLKCQYLKMHAEKAIDIIYLEVSGGKGGDKKLRTTRK